MNDKETEVTPQRVDKLKLYSFLKFVAILCVGGLSIVSGVLRVSQYSHYIAIAIGWIVLVALLYNAFHDKLIKFRIFASLSIVALPLCGALAYYIGPNLPEETDTHGWLYPADDPVPTTTCFPDRPGITFILGRNISKIDNNIQKLVVLQVDKTPLIAVEREGDRLIFDATIYNKEGIIAAKIDRGEFRLNPKATFYGEHANKNRSDLTVYDDHNQQLLHIYYANPSTVFISGVFYSEAGSQVIITDQAIFVSSTRSVFYGDCLLDYGLGVSRNALFQTKPILTGSKP